MLLLGKLVNTHGIKGEVRIKSDFKYKQEVFKIGNYLYINDDKLKINSYRVHKDYDMVTFENINDINDVLKYKGKNVYIKKEEYDFPGILNEDLINLPVYADDKLIGKVKEIIKNVNQEILVLDNNVMIPFVEEFIKNIDEEKIEVNLVKGLINED